MTSSKNKITLFSPWGILHMRQVSIFFSWSSFGDTEAQSFSFLPTWLPHHVTNDIIIITKTFYMSSHTYGENCANRISGCRENRKLSWRRTDRRTKNLKILCFQRLRKQRHNKILLYLSQVKVLQDVSTCFTKGSHVRAERCPSNFVPVEML